MLTVLNNNNNNNNSSENRTEVLNNRNISRISSYKFENTIEIFILNIH